MSEAKTTSFQSVQQPQSWLQRLVRPMRELKRWRSTNQRKTWNPDGYIWKNETRSGEAPRPRAYKNLKR